MGEFIIDKMEVLSIGEKVRKLRIKRGVRLKDICSENLSISKISCIENNKIRADENSLRILADKLGTSYEYLSKDIKEQISENISYLNQKEMDLYIFEKYTYNLHIALNHNLYDLTFKICNSVFNKFIFGRNFSPYLEKISDIIPIYFDSLLKIKDVSKEIIYNLDLGIYFLIIQEYGIASYYFKFLRRLISSYDVLESYGDIILICEINCYINLREYDKLYFFKDKFEALNHKDSLYVYDIIYFEWVFNIKYNFEDVIIKNIFYEFENCLFEKKIEYIYKLGKILYELGHLKECIYVCEKLYSILGNGEFEKCRSKYLICKSLVYVSRIYIENMDRKKLGSSIENALNLSISCEYMELMLELYFYKAVFYMKRGEFSKVTKYINLCTHFLERVRYKIGDEVYLNVGFIFYELKDRYEAIKNFSFLN